MSGERRSIIFLVRMVGERPYEYFGAEFAGDFLCAINAATIHNDDFIGKTLNGTETPRQVFLFVLRDEADTEAVHAATPAPVSHRDGEGKQTGGETYFLAWKLRRMVVPPTRNSAPSCRIAARIRSSSKKVPFVESRSFKLTKVSRTSMRQ